MGPGEVCAVLCLDNKKVANTEWKPPSNAAWEQQFKLDLDKVWISFSTSAVCKVLPRLYDYNTTCILCGGPNL